MYKVDHHKPSVMRGAMVAMIYHIKLKFNILLAPHVVLSYEHTNPNPNSNILVSQQFGIYFICLA